MPLQPFTVPAPRGCAYDHPEHRPPENIGAAVTAPSRWYCPACGHETLVLPDDLTKSSVRGWLAWAGGCANYGYGTQAKDVAEVVGWLAALLGRVLKELPKGE